MTRKENAIKRYSMRVHSLKIKLSFDKYVHGWQWNRHKINLVFCGYIYIRLSSIAHFLIQVCVLLRHIQSISYSLVQEITNLITHLIKIRSKDGNYLTGLRTNYLKERRQRFFNELRLIDQYHSKHYDNDLKKR